MAARKAGGRRAGRRGGSATGQPGAAPSGPRRDVMLSRLMEMAPQEPLETRRRIYESLIGEAPDAPPAGASFHPAHVDREAPARKLFRLAPELPMESQRTAATAVEKRAPRQPPKSIPRTPQPGSGNA